MEKTEWYFEYELQFNRPGLLGDISSLLGMLSINIIMINGIEKSKRGMLLLSEHDEYIERLKSILDNVSTIKITKLRRPKLRDRLAVRHGKYLQRDSEDRKTVRFVREEFGLLIDFMAELFKDEGHKLIGVRGMPRVGKSETIVAGSVSANKRWLFVSSTLLKQTLRSKLIEGEYGEEFIYIIDGVVSHRGTNEEHWQLIREIMQIPAIKVVEHPDVFIQATDYTIEDFDYIIEIRRDDDEKITYEPIQNQLGPGSNGMFEF